MPVSDSAEQLATSNHATDFKNAVQRLTTDSIVTDVQIYVDFPDDLKTLDTYPNTKNILAPLSQAKGTYWYGIFQGTQQSSLFCPAFYLGEREKKKIRRSCIYYFHDLLLSRKSPSGLHRPLQFFRLSLRYVER